MGISWRKSRRSFVLKGVGFRRFSRKSARSSKQNPPENPRKNLPENPLQNLPENPEKPPQNPPWKHAPSSSCDRLRVAVCLRHLSALFWMLRRNQTSAFRCKFHSKSAKEIHPDPLFQGRESANSKCYNRQLRFEALSSSEGYPPKMNTQRKSSRKQFAVWLLIVLRGHGWTV